MVLARVNGIYRTVESAMRRQAHAAHQTAVRTRRQLHKGMGVECHVTRRQMPGGPSDGNDTYVQWKRARQSGVIYAQCSSLTGIHREGDD